MWRHHLHEAALQWAVKIAMRRVDVAKRVSCHTFKQSFARLLLHRGQDIRTIRELLGHKEVSRAMVYTQV